MKSIKYILEVYNGETTETYIVGAVSPSMAVQNFLYLYEEAHPDELIPRVYGVVPLFLEPGEE